MTYTITITSAQAKAISRVVANAAPHAAEALISKHADGSGRVTVGIIDADGSNVTTADVDARGRIAYDGEDS